MITEKSVAILRETRPGENRVLICPGEVRAFRDAGFDVLVERDAGLRAGLSDAAFRAAGAHLVGTAEAWANRFVLKYKAPSLPEYRYFRRDMVLAAFFHAEDDGVLVEAMSKAGLTAYSLEFLKGEKGASRMPTGTDEIAGKMAVFYGAYFLQGHFGGSGTLLAGVTGVAAPKVLVIGYGGVGGASARMAASLGCRVTVLGTNALRLRRFQSTVPESSKCYVNTPQVLAREIRDADVVIGAILVSTYDTPTMLGKELLRTMKPGSIIVDVTCGYGDGLGWMPTFHRQTTHAYPVYVVEGVLHCKIDSLPASVPRTSSQATSSALAPALIRLGDALYSASTDPLSETGKIIANGAVVHPVVVHNLKRKAQTP